MASFEIIENNAPYYKIVVRFNGFEFGQSLVSSKTGEDLQTQLQGYADDYEREYVAPIVAVEPE
jgi:hypothetical protein